MSDLTGPVRPGMNRTPIGKADLSSLNPDLGAALEGNEGTPSATNPFVTEEGLFSTTALGLLECMVSSRTRGIILTHTGKPVLMGSAINV